MLSSKSSNKLWQLYLDQVRSKQMHSLEALGLKALQHANERNFAANPMDGTGVMEHDQQIAKLLDFYKNENIETSRHIDNERSDEARLVDLGVAFVNAAANPKKLKFLKVAHQLGFPVNFQHPSHLGAALHKAAFFNNEKTIKWLISTGECDYPLLDKYERSAVDLIQLEHPYNDELLDELHILTYKAATETGIDYAQNKRERFKRWLQSNWFHERLERIGNNRIYVNGLD